MKEPLLLKIFEICILKSWWMFVILLVALFIFEKGLIAQNMEVVRLKKRVWNLEQEITSALKRKQNLYDYINNQENIRTIEFVLIQKLGLVPEQHIKIYFSPKSDISND